MLASVPARVGGRARARTGPRFAVVYEDSFNYLSKMCLAPHARRPLRHDRRGARPRGCLTLVSGSDATDHDDGVPGARRDRGHPRRGRGHAVRGRWPRSPRAARPRCTTSRASRSGPRTARVVRTRAAPVPQGPGRAALPPGTSSTWTATAASGASRHGYHSMNLATTRGCPYHCNWCAKPIYGQRYAVRSPRRRGRGDGLAEAHATRPTTSGSWTTSSACGRAGWRSSRARSRRADARAALQVPLARGPAGRRHGVARCGAPAAARSGSAPSRDRRRSSTRWRRGTTVEQIRDAPRRGCTRPGIEVGFFLQFGYPGETREDIEPTLPAGRATAGPDDIGISVSYPLPGTPLLRAGEGASWAPSRNWDDSNDLAMMYRGPFSHRVLPRAPPRGAPGVPAAAACAAAPRAARAAPRRCCTTRPRCPGPAPPGAPGPRGRTTASGRSARRCHPRRPPSRASRVVSPMDLLLTHGYFLAEDAQERRVMKPYPPLGLLYISSHLKARASRWASSTRPSRASSPSERTCERERPSVVGLYCNLMTKRNVLRMAAECRRVGARVVVGGPEPPADAEEYLARGTDVVVIGEGEVTLEELLPLLAGSAGPPRLVGGGGPRLSRRSRTAWCARAPRALIRNLDAQPLPDREAVDVAAYLARLARAPRLRLALAAHRARLPVHLPLVQPVRLRRDAPPALARASVADEVEWLARALPARPALVRGRRVHDPSRLRARAGRRDGSGAACACPFECISRADRIDEDVADALAAPGLLAAVDRLARAARSACSTPWTAA